MHSLFGIIHLSSFVKPFHEFESAYDYCDKTCNNNQTGRVSGSIVFIDVPFEKMCTEDNENEYNDAFGYAKGNDFLYNFKRGFILHS